MSIAGCSCAGRLGNTGFPSVKPFGVRSGFLMVPILADDGTRNGLDLTSTTLGADLLAMVNNVDPSKRAYPFLNLRNVTSTEAEATFETADNGERFKLRDGIKTIMFDVWNVTNQYYNKVSGACVEFGLYDIDVCGNIRGEKDGDYLYPRPVNQASFNSTYIDATNEAGSKVHFEMDYDLITNDGDQWMLSIADFGAYDPLQLKGMIDVRLSLVDITDNVTIVLDAEFDYGFANAPKVWTGGVLADFTAYNDTDDSALTISTVTESTVVPGRYTIVLDSPQTYSDLITFDVFKAATANLMNGYEGIEYQATWEWS